MRGIYGDRWGFGSLGTKTSPAKCGYQGCSPAENQAKNFIKFCLRGGKRMEKLIIRTCIQLVIILFAERAFKSYWMECFPISKHYIRQIQISFSEEQIRISGPEGVFLGGLLSTFTRCRQSPTRGRTVSSVGLQVFPWWITSAEPQDQIYISTCFSPPNTIGMPLTELT